MCFFCKVNYATLFLLCKEAELKASTSYVNENAYRENICDNSKMSLHVYFDSETALIIIQINSKS